MPKIKLILILLLIAFKTGAQDFNNFEEVNNTSYSLYTLEKWDELIQYGKKALENKQDFLYLRLRLGYAYIIKNNYSEAIVHYNKVLEFNRHNEIAHYYLWWSYTALNQEEFANQHIPFLNHEVKKSLEINKLSLTSIGLESSYKTTDVTTRKDAIFNRIFINYRLNWRINMQQSVIFYQQKIAEPKLTSVENNSNININQKEYHNALSLALNKRLELKASYHFIQTPFNNFNYTNHIGLVGVKLYSKYMNFQGSFLKGKLIDSKTSQFNLQLEYFPYGNTNLYGSTTISYRALDSSANTIAKQILGIKLNKQTWIEGNFTLGEANRYFENDGLYTYNSIDPNMIKWGCNAYYFSGKHIKFQIGYTMERRRLTLYNPQILFYQHSINGGITWKF
jgi:tetratricopeptide (TPR) repeat protein